MILHPRHRSDCTEFFRDPDKTAPMQVDGPDAAIDAIGRASAEAGRSWTDQFNYILGICLGDHTPDFDDGRTTEDWRTLLSPCRFRFSETADWNPCTWLWATPPPRAGCTKRV